MMVAPSPRTTRALSRGRPFRLGPTARGGGPITAYASKEEQMAKSTKALEPHRGPAHPTPVWDAITSAPDPQARMEASRAAMSLVTFPDLGRPTPALFADLPWQDSEQAQSDILARLISAPDLQTAMAAPQDLPDMSTYVGETITIWGGVARRGDIEEAWGAYVSLDITVKGKEEHLAVNTSSAEVVVIFWRAYVEGTLPVTGQVILKGQPKPGRNQPIGLVALDAFE